MIVYSFISNYIRMYGGVELMAEMFCYIRMGFEHDNDKLSMVLGSLIHERIRNFN